MAWCQRLELIISAVSNTDYVYIFFFIISNIFNLSHHLHCHQKNYTHNRNGMCFHILTLNMLNCLKYYKKMYSHFVSYLGYCSTEDEIHNAATLHVAYLILSIPCLLILRWLQEAVHQQAWYWSPKPEYSISSIRRVKITLIKNYNYRQVSNIRRTFVCSKIVDHSDVVGASPVGAAPTTSSFSI